ncbi:MAG: 50S ribosomal protein L24 [Candidatus Thermoplasmatota archaeon]|nr:50S ribosomal protein L24 [Candidatus Thermoplasmatota archaeon]
MKSIKSRKQRKAYFNAPLHKRRKWMSAHLEENLLLKYDLRRVPVVQGDTVRAMRGSFKGHEGKVSHVNVRRRQVEVEGLVMTKADGKKIAKPIHASNLLITKLNLTDRWRREKLERDLSEDVKKGIEREAEEQISEAEEEQRKEEEAKKEEEEASAEETEKPAEKIEEAKEGTEKPKTELERKTDERESKTETKSTKTEERKTEEKSSGKTKREEKPETEKTKEKPAEKSKPKRTENKKTTAKKKSVKKTPAKITKKKEEEDK